MILLQSDGMLKPVIKILTDYPRDDLAHDEVHQALVTACAKHRVESFSLDVGAITGLDTVAAGFKTAQLALNSQLGFGHVFHTNCAPRKNLVSVKSQGEKVVLGMTPSGVAMLMVNAGHALAPFYDLAKEGAVTFYQTSVPDSGSQFRSRDFFPDAVAELAAHLAAQAKKLGAAAISKLLAEKAFEKILEGLSFVGSPLAPGAIHPLPQGAVFYVDNFGNIKLNFRHSQLLRLYLLGTEMVVKIGDSACNAVLGGAGFSQGEGIVALTEGSSGWRDARGNKECFTEIFLRGARAAARFGDFHTGDLVLGLAKADLEKAVAALHAAGGELPEEADIENLSEAQIIGLLGRARLIRNGFDAAELRRALEQGTLLQHIRGKA